MKQTEQEQQDNGDLVLLIWQIEKLRRREGGCTMNELISEAKKNFEGIEQIKIKKIMKQTAVKDLAYYKANAEEDYLQVPISVLRYISQLEQQQGYSEEEVELIANEMVNWAIDNVENSKTQSGKKFDEIMEKFKNK